MDIEFQDLIFKDTVLYSGSGKLMFRRCHFKSNHVALASFESTNKRYELSATFKNCVENIVVAANGLALTMIYCLITNKTNSCIDVNASASASVNALLYCM